MTTLPPPLPTTETEKPDYGFIAFVACSAFVLLGLLAAPMIQELL